MQDDTIEFTLTGCHARLIGRELGITPTQARVVEALYKAKGIPMSARDLDEAVPPNQGHGRMVDVEFRNPKSMAVVVWQTRKRLPPGFIQSANGRGGDSGYWIEKPIRDLIKKALENVEG